MRKKVVIVGGGISGLSAAFYLQKYSNEQNLPTDIVVLEKGPHFGGKINTLRKDGFVIERGPDSFLARKTPIIDLTRELGLEDQLVGTNPAAKKTYILKKGRLHRMPPGLSLGIPTEVMPFLKTKLISPMGKLRAGLDLLLPRGQNHTDESLGDFLERRLGKDVVSQIAEPLLSGIYAGDAKALSLQATFPQFKQMEQKYRSLILGMLASKKHSPSTEKLPKVAESSLFLTYKNGLSTLVETLLDKLTKEGVTLLSSVGLERIHTASPESNYQLHLSNGQVLEADGVIMATPPGVSADLLTEYVPKVRELYSIRYVSVGNVVMTFNREDIPHPLDGSGFVVPRTEQRHITACTWTSVKWLHTAPKDQVLLRCYVGRSGEEEIVHLPDEEIMKRVLQDLEELMGIQVTPSFYEITRLAESMPQYPIGHVERIQQVRKQLSATLPGVLLTGAGYEGVGIPDCVRQGRDTAREMIKLLG